MSNEFLKITKNTLKKWHACVDGYKKFNELLPNGGTLEESIKALDESGHGFGTDKHDDWSFWLFKQSTNDDDYKNQTLSGYRNSGDYNSGYYNSGDYNSGNRNSGDYNSGNRNSGDYNSGDYNSGDYNSGDYNSGWFNDDTPTTTRVFGVETDRIAFEEMRKPDFIFNVCIKFWVSENNMTDEDKKNDPKFYARGGQLRTRDYKEAWKLAWDNADKENRELIRTLPNFNAEKFYNITGIDLRQSN